jgi:hypothetical protein
MRDMAVAMDRCLVPGAQFGANGGLRASGVFEFEQRDDSEAVSDVSVTDGALRARAISFLSIEAREDLKWARPMRDMHWCPGLGRTGRSNFVPLNMTGMLHRQPQRRTDGSTGPPLFAAAIAEARSSRLDRPY